MKDNIRVIIYDSNNYKSMKEAQLECAHISFESFGDYDDAENNELMDVLRALVTNSRFEAPVCVAVRGNELINVYSGGVSVPIPF